MVESPLTRLALRVATALTLAFIYLPLLVIALYAFNAVYYAFNQLSWGEERK